MVISTFVQQPLSLSDIRRLILTPPRRITAGISCFSPGKGETTEPSSTAGMRRKLVGLGIGIIASSFVTLQDANATRVEYYATVGEPSCELTFAKSGLGYCDTKAGTGVEPPIGELINVSELSYLTAYFCNLIHTHARSYFQIHYTARFADGTVFDSSYKRGRPLTMRIGVGKVLPGLDQGIMGGADVPPMFVGILLDLVQHIFFGMLLLRLIYSFFRRW